MSLYQIGKDIQSLITRIEALEDLTRTSGPDDAVDEVFSGIEESDDEGVDETFTVQAALSALTGLPEGSRAESRTFRARVDPAVHKLSDGTPIYQHDTIRITVVRAQDASGRTIVTASYSAFLTSLGYFSRLLDTTGFRGAPYRLTLIDRDGGPVHPELSLRPRVIVDCDDNRRRVVYSKQLDSDVFDTVRGYQGQVSGHKVARCR